MEKEETVEKQSRVKKHTAAHSRKVWIAVGIGAGMLVLIYLIGAIFYHSHFLPGTTINGTSVANKSASAAENLFLTQAQDYVLTLTERDSATEEISGTEIDLEVSFDGEFAELISKQNAFAWVGALFHGNEETVTGAVQYNESTLNTILASLDCMEESTWTTSENASLSAYSDGYTLEDAVYGTAIDVEAFYAAVEDAVSGVSTELDMSEAGCYDDPTYEADSDEAQAMLATANTYTGVTITYTFGSSSEVVDGAKISEWIVVDDQMNVSLDESLVAEYVSGLASSYNTAGQSKTLVTAYGSTVTVPGGTYGWKINQDDTVSALIAQITSGEDYEGDVEYTQTAESHDGNDYGSTYVEINLSAQHLYYYVNGEQLVSTDFVSGCVEDGNETPTGAYFVTYTEKDATLNGENYSTDVSYWMPFAGNVGMHDATWRSSFGGAIYLYSGSHGCVNLPYSAAQTIFNNISAGTAVLVYELDGTENAAVDAYYAAQKVEKLIGKIGDVTKKSESAITKAREAYDALTSTGQGYVDNYDTLTAAEKAYAKLVENEEAQDAADEVIDLIKDIGTVTSDSGSAITAARSAYDALSKKAKKLVTNYSKLKAAESAYAALQ